MSRWIAVYQFPLDKDLSELALFIRRHRLPLRLAEENNRQILATPDPQLGEFLRPLLERWEAGEIDLARVHLQPVEAVEAESASGDSETAPTKAGPAETAPAEESARGSAKESEEIAVPSPLPSWPWRKTPLSLLLIALCFIGFFLLRYDLAEALIIYPDRGGDFHLQQSTLARHWAQGEYWRLWTPAIVHFSLPHALFNALGIWILGRPLEARAGTLVFAALVFCSAAASNLAQYYWSPQTVFGGMSGVVYALVGGVFILQRWQPDWRDVPAGLVAVAVGWLVFCATGLVTYVFGVGVANAAHIGGFVCGLLLVLLYCLAGGARHFSDNAAGNSAAA